MRRGRKQRDTGRCPWPSAFARDPAVGLSELGVLEELERDYYMDALAVLRGAIDSDELTHLMATGASMNEDEAISQAQALE